MKPVNTFASELLRKVSKKDTYKGLDANQVFLSIQENPKIMVQRTNIYIKKENSNFEILLEFLTIKNMHV